MDEIPEGFEGDPIGKSNVSLIPTPAGPAISLLDVEAMTARLERIEADPQARWEMLRMAIGGLIRIGSL